MLTLTEKVADDLLGTCDDLDSILNNYNLSFSDVDNLFHSDLMALIIRCEQCSWWVEPHEVDENHICSDCQVV